MTSSQAFVKVGNLGKDFAIKISSMSQFQNKITIKSVLKFLVQASIAGIDGVTRGVVHMYNGSLKIPIQLITKWLKSISPFFKFNGLMLNVGVSFGVALTFFMKAFFETIGATLKWWKNGYHASNKSINRKRFFKDLERIFISNTGGGIVGAITTFAVGVLLTKIFAVTWVVWIAAVIGGIFGMGTKNYINNKIYSEEHQKYLKDCKIWKEFAKKDNKKKKYNKEERWPQKLDDMAKYFDALGCLKYARLGTLTTQKIDTNYKNKCNDIKDNSDDESGLELDLKKLELYKIICDRYVIYIQNPANDKKVYDKTGSDYTRKELIELKRCVVNICNSKWQKKQGNKTKKSIWNYIFG